MTEHGTGDVASEPTAVWYSDEKQVLVILIILAAALTLPYFRDFNIRFTETHPAILALLGGFITAVALYLPMRYADPKFAFSNAVLIGLLVAEFNVYGALSEFPAPVVVAFFFFMYLYGRNEAEHMWPTEYTKGKY